MLTMQEKEIRYSCEQEKTRSLYTQNNGACRLSGRHRCLLILYNSNRTGRMIGLHFVFLNRKVATLLFIFAFRALTSVIP